MSASHLWKVIIDGPRVRGGPDGVSRFWVYVAGTAADRAGAIAAALRQVTKVGPAFGESGPFAVKQSRVVETLASDPRGFRPRVIGELVRFEAWFTNA